MARIKIVRKKVLVRRTPIRGSRKILVKVKGVRISSSVPNARQQRLNGEVNVSKIKGSYVYSIKERKLTKAERQKLRKLTVSQRKARKERIYAKIDALLKANNPLNLKIGKRV